MPEVADMTFALRPTLNAVVVRQKLDVEATHAKALEKLDKLSDKLRRAPSHRVAQTSDFCR